MADYNMVSEQMRRLEELSEENLDLALIEMVNLYFMASFAMNHEVCDAIDLWIYESKSLTIRDYLNEQIQENNARNRQYERWIQMYE